MSVIGEVGASPETPHVNLVVGAVQLRKYGKFLDDYVEKLNKVIEKQTDPGDVITGNEIIIVKFSGKDFVEVGGVVSTDNKVLNKVVTVMAALCVEVRERVTEAKQFYNFLLTFGEELDSGGTRALTATTRHLPLLQDVANFVDRCQTVITEFLQQLAAVYIISANNQIINASEMHFEDMMHHLGELLVVLVTLDALILSLEPLHDAWTLLKRLIPSVQLLDNSDKVRNLSKVITQLQCNLLSGKIFRGACDRLSGWVPTGSSIGDELQLYVRNMMNSLESKQDGLVKDSGALFLRSCCIFTLTALCLGIHDKRLLKLTLDVAKKFPTVPLAGPCIWNPDEFFQQNLDHFMKSDDRKLAATLPPLRADLIAQHCRNLTFELSQLSQDVCLWSIDLDSIVTNEINTLTVEELKRRCNGFLQGAKIASQIKLRIKLIMNGHASQMKPMTRSIVLHLCGLTELLAAIGRSYETNSFAIAESVHHVTEYLSHEVLAVIIKTKKRLTADKGCTKRHLDALSALVLAQNALSGPVTPTRLLVLRLALSVARGAQAKVIRDEEVDDLYSKIQRLDQLSTLQTTIREACDCSHLYHQRVILPVYLDHGQPCRMSFLLSSLQDVTETIPAAVRQRAMQEFETTLRQELESRSHRKTQDVVETSLRLQVHSHLQTEKRPVDMTSLRLQPMRYFSKVFSIKGDVEGYLDRTFYNLTTVALHDWRSYGEMRALAKFQLGLTLVKDSLPCQTLEQGLDVLEVIRNMHVFVAGYQYNMNNQLFIERESRNKHLNTIGIRHVSNSIRTHGTGIVNTTVNFIYQFLRNKFYIFSQFLFDEQIKSRLAKDAAIWREAHARGDEFYPYERAEKFVKGVRKLGVSDGLSYLDQFRILITQIGNAMGYVRLVRSGGMHACSDALSFIPETEVTFADRCEDLSCTTHDAASRLDRVVQSLAANFADGCNYFRMLVDVFAADFRNPKHGHLNNFYIIVPPLTVSYVDHMVAGKEKVARRKGGVWTDDGFAMGLAYVLTLLGQHDKLVSLHWFDSARAQHTRDPQTMMKISARGQQRCDDDTAASVLTAKRLGAHMQEFDLLAFCLNSAKIFFKKQATTEVN